MNKLIEDYRKIETKIHPFVEFLEKNKDSSKLKGLYKGIVTMQSPVIDKPEILFLGLNPGQGAYIELNNRSKTKNDTPIRMLGKNEMCFNELNWYEKGNARRRKKGNWEGYEWYETDKPVNNSFTTRMIDLLDMIAKLKYPEQSKIENGNSKIPFWFEGFGQRIMATNLYPIATTNFQDLQKIHRYLAKEKSLRHNWQSPEKMNKKVNDWELRKFFIGLTNELIDLVKPRIIVCQGKQAFHDFTYTSRSKGKLVSRSKTIKGHDYKVIGFSRQGNWSSLLKELSVEIAAEI